MTKRAARTDNAQNAQFALFDKTFFEFKGDENFYAKLKKKASAGNVLTWN